MQYYFDILNKCQSIQTFFSQRKDGSMKLTTDPALKEMISSNRIRFFLENSINQKRVVSAEIVHGNKINKVVEDDGGKTINNADGLITQDKNIFLSITSADCLPIFLFEPEKEIIGMIHAGWRSLEKNIIQNAAQKIKELGGKPENILAGIGPAICQKHYGVGSEIAEKFAGYPETIKNDGGKIYLNIKKIALLQLLEWGVKKKNIEISPECTFELPRQYFSARRDQKKEVEAMVSLIGIRNI